MYALCWLIAIVVSLVAVANLVSAIVAAARGGQALMTALGIGLTCGFALILGLSRSAYGGAYLALVAAVAFACLGRVLVRQWTPNASHAERVQKLSAAHLTLIGGSLMFLIPFAWLLSTSLKPDDEMAIFPPVWIPTQQVTSSTLKNDEDKSAGLSWYTPPAAKGHPAGPKVQVAEVVNLPSGDIKIRVVSPGSLYNHTVVVKPDDLTKIRHTSPKWDNYLEALTYLPPETRYGLLFLGNTLFLTLMTVVGTLLSSSLVAYSFARLRWPGRETLFIVLLATMMIPGAVTMMPQFLIYRSLGWIDTLRPLWVASFFGSAFNIFLLRQFFMSIPTELEDAAKIDGCGPFGIYWRIMMPLVKPALAAIAIMGVLGAWNNFQGPLIYLSSQEKMPLAYALQLYQQQHGGEPGLLMAASTMVVLPIIVLFFFTQRYFIEGVSLTGMGGR